MPVRGRPDPSVVVGMTDGVVGRIVDVGDMVVSVGDSVGVAVSVGETVPVGDGEVGEVVVTVGLVVGLAVVMVKVGVGD
jgi:hypothetical protein